MIYIDKENLHHAYLIEGNREKEKEIVDSLGLETKNNPDFIELSMDSFKIEDAFNLREMASQKAFKEGKKVFIISANSLTWEAQGALLKIFEEPIAGTHFFLIVPDASALLPTLRSRFYFISGDAGSDFSEAAERFVKMFPAKRIDFLKELLAEDEDDESGRDSARARAGRFLNALEAILHDGLKTGDIGFFEQIFKVRQYLRQPGSSAKNLLESLALSIPVL